MLIISGLLTLLVISHAGCAGIKGGLHTKGAAPTQEQVAQEDIPSPYSIKSGPTFGTKVSTGDAAGRIKTVMSKKAPSPALHHSVKTAIDRTSKTHPVPGLHHTATSPVAQDQVLIDDSTVDSSGIKTIKTATSGKTRFSQSDSQVRDPVARPVVQTIKTAQNPVTDSSQGVKTLKTIDTGKTLFSERDKQQRDPTARPIIQTLQSTVDSTSDSTKTLKTVTRGKTRFSQGDTQVRDPVARTVIQTVKTDKDSSAIQQTVKTSIKTEPSDIGRKTIKSSQKNVESASASSVPESIVQAARRNTLRISVPDSELAGNQGISAGSTNVQGIQLLSNLESQMQSGFDRVNDRGEITINEETIRSLQNAGSIVRENGEISLNEEAIRLLQNAGGSSIDPSSIILRSNPNENSAARIPSTEISGRRITYAATGDERKENAVVMRPQIRSQGLGQTGRVSNQNQRQSGRTRVTGLQNNNILMNTRTQNAQTTQRGNQMITSGENLRSQGTTGIRQSTTTTNAENIIFNGKEINIRGLTTGQLFDENLQPILTDKADISRRTDIRIPSTPDIRQPITSSRVTQTAAISSLTSNAETRRRIISGANRRRQQNVNIPIENVEFRTPARQPISTIVQTGTSTSGLRSQGAAGIRQSTTTGSQETVLFNGREVSVPGAQAGQLFDENLQPILSENAAISGQANLRASPVPQIPQPVRSTGVTQTAGVSSFTSSTGSLTRTSGATRRRQQAVTTPRENVQLRTRIRQPTSSVVQTGTSTAELRSQGAAGIRQSTTTGSQETVLFKGREVSVPGAQAGQLFDENLKPILSENAAISGQANLRASPVPQIPQPVRSTGVTQTGGVSSFTSSTGSLTRTSGATRRRQQAVTTPRENVQLRTRIRQPTSSVVQTGTSTAELRSQGAAGIRQSTTTGSQETVLFKGREVSVPGAQAGQLFDENLQPILSENAAISGQANLRASPVPQIPQPVRSTGVTQTAGVSSFTSSTGSLTRTSGATRRRQQAVTTPRENVQLRTRIRQPTSSVVQTGTSTAELRSQGAAGIRQSTTTGSQEAVLFKGREVSVPGAQAGQLFDENLKPILSENAAISGQANLRASPVPQIPQPVRSTGVTQTAGVSSFTSSTGSLTRTSGATRRRQQAVTTPRENVQLRTRIRQPTSTVVQTGTSTAGLRSQGAAGIRQSTTTGSQETVLFKGREVNVPGAQAGQLFDENLKPILSENAAISGQANLRASPVPQIPQPERSTGVTQTGGVSSFTSSTGSLTRTSGATRRRQQAVTTPREKVQLRTPARQPTSSVVQTGTSTTGLRSEGAAGIRQSTISGSQETVLFNGKEISVGGLQAGQLFDENLQPILSDKATISGPANLRASPVPQIPQPVRSTGGTQTGGVSSFTSSTGSLTQTTTGANRRRQQAVTTQREKVQLRTPTSSVVQTGTSTAGLRSQVAADIRQSTTTGSQETVLFNGREVSVPGAQVGQLFDENLKPILSENAAISGQANLRASPVPQSPQSVRSTGVTQTGGVSSFTSSTGSLTRTSGTTRRRQQAVTAPREKVQLRTPARQPTSSVVQTGTSTAGLRSEGAAGIRQSTISGSQETVLFNGKEISVGGLQAGQLFDENLQPILSDKETISGRANLRASPVPQIPQPVRSTGGTQTGDVSSFTSSTGSFTQTTTGTRRRQQTVTTPREGVQLRTPVRQPTSSVVQTGTSTAGLRSQGAAGIRQSTTTGSQETVLFNGREVSVPGAQAGQLFDENLKPILSENAAISGQANLRASPVPQIPQPVRSTGVTQTAGVSSFTSSTGSLTRTSGATRRRQQAVTTPRENVQLRTRIRQPTSTVVQTGTSTAGLRSQGAAGIRQSTTTGSQETVLFKGREVNVPGAQAGQLFDENLKPILSENAAISGQANLRASPVPQIPQPERSTGVTQTGGVSSFTSSTGSLTRTSGATRRRQQAVTTPREKVQLRTPARQPTSSVVQTGTSTTGLRSEGAAGIRQSTISGSQETVLFNGKEISVGGLQAGQLFDENLQPILSDKATISGPANLRASPVPQIPQPVRSTGGTQTGGVSSFTSSTGSLTQTTTGANRRRQQAVTTQREKVQLRTPTSSVVQTGTSTAGLRSQGAADIRQSTTTGSQETVLFNGREVSVPGAQVGQLFDENLKPILSENAAISGQANLRASPVPQSPQSVRSTGVTQTGGVSSFTSSTGSLTRTSGTTRRRQQAVTAPREKVQLRTPARQPTSSVVQTGTSTAGLRSEGAAGIRQSTISGSQETVLFNGKEISVGGLQAGQLFDENLQPILSDKETISGRANLRASPVPQIPQPVRSTGGTQTGDVSSFTSSTGSFTQTTTGTRRRQQTVTTPREGVQLRTPVRQPTSSVVQTGTSTAGLRSQGAAGIRQSTTTGSQETVLFNGREVSVPGAQAGQLFDENLKPILSENAAISGQANLRASPVPQISQPMRSTGVTQTAGVSSFTSSTGSLTRTTSGATRRRQQAVTTPREGVQLRTPVRQPTSSVVQTGTSTAGLRSQGAAGTRLSTTTRSQETVLFNGREVSVPGAQAGQLFDENLQPILSDRAAISGEANVRVSSLPQIPQPVRSVGVTQTAGVSSFTSSTGSLTRTSSGVTDKDSKPTDVSVGSQSGSISRGSGLRASGLPMRQYSSRPVSSGYRGQSSSISPIPNSGTISNTETVLFNGKEISIGGLREGQLFDENLRPISPGRIEDDISAAARIGSTQRTSASSLRTEGEPRRSSPASAMRSGGLLGDSRSYIGSSRSSSSQSSNPFTSSRRLGLPKQNFNSRRAENSGIQQLNAGGIAYTSDTGSSGSNFQRKISQDRITQEISQDRVETRVIQEKKDIPVVPQLKVEDVVEQTSLTNPTALKAVQVQETVPFTISGTPSKPSFSKISQLSQKNIDIPTVQQQVLTGDFSGYLPKTSFLPPFNYGVPVISASKYSVKSPIVQEQQKVEQEFV